MRMRAVRVLSWKIPCSLPACSAAWIDAVEPLCVAAGEVVVFQLRIRADLELVAHRADLHGFRDRLHRFQVVIGQFEGVSRSVCFAVCAALASWSRS